MADNAESDPLEIIDFHTHLLHTPGDSQGRDLGAYASDRFYGKTMDEFLTFEAGGMPYPAVQEVLYLLRSLGLPQIPHWFELIASLKNAGHGGVTRAVILPIEGDGISITHEETIRLVQALPDNLLGAVSVLPTEPGAPALLEKKLEQMERANSPDYRPVVKLHPLIQDFDAREISANFWEVLNARGAWLEFHTGPFQSGPCFGERDLIISDPAVLEHVARNYPNISIGLAHCGTLDSAIDIYWGRQMKIRRHFPNAVRMISDYPNVFANIGGLMWTGSTKAKPGGDPINKYNGKTMAGHDFTKNAQSSFDRLAADMGKRAALHGPVFRCDGSRDMPRLRDKFVPGSDYPIVNCIQREITIKQPDVLGACRDSMNPTEPRGPARNCRVLRRR